MSATGNVGNKSYRAAMPVLTADDAAKQIIENAKFCGSVQVAYDFWNTRDTPRHFARSVVRCIKDAGFDIEE